jgi:uncharacterized LabA/DUF88 family protein
MPPEPIAKRALAFFDGQNLFYAAKEAYGYPYPNYDPHRLAQAVCAAKGWDLSGIHFYTGVPDQLMDADRHYFWAAKLAVMGTRGIQSFTRPLRYQNKVITLRDGTITTAPVGREKGIDVRLALDIVRFALENRYDVALIFSQDQDLTEAVDDVKKIAQREQRWIKLACAFPVSATYGNKRGINGTEWVKLDRATYDACLDPNDYRRKGMK